jgi:PAS domain-containing protein
MNLAKLQASAFNVLALGASAGGHAAIAEEVRQRTRELRQAEEFLQATLDSSPYIVQAFEAVRDENGKIVDFIWVFNNQAGYRQNGDVIGKSLLQQNPGGVATGLFAKFVEVTETGVSYDQEQFYNHEQFDGWFHQTLVKMGDGFVMNTEDITERKRAGEAAAAKPQSPRAMRTRLQT